MPQHVPGRPDRRGRGGRLLRVAPALLVGVVGAALAPAAHAHDEVVDSSPRAGTVVAEAPSVVELEFAGAIVSSSVEVVDGCGREVSSTATDDGRTVRAEVAVVEVPDARGGWTVSWETIGGDGHEVEGELTFAVDGAPDCSVLPASTPAEAPTEVDATAVAVPDEPALSRSIAGGEATGPVAVGRTDRPVVPTAPLLAGGVVLLAGAGVVIGSRWQGRRPGRPRA